MIRKLLYILSALVAWLEDRQDKKRQKKAQEARDALEQDYRRWFAEKFGGENEDDYGLNSEYNPDNQHQSGDKSDAGPSSGHNRK